MGKAEEEEAQEEEKTELEEKNLKQIAFYFIHTIILLIVGLAHQTFPG